MIESAIYVVVNYCEWRVGGELLKGVMTFDTPESLLAVKEALETGVDVLVPCEQLDGTTKLRRLDASTSLEMTTV